MDVLVLILLSSVLYMLLLAAETLHKLAVRLMQRHIRVHFRWEPESQFLGSSIVGHGGFMDVATRDLSLNLGVLPSVAKYERPKSSVVGSGPCEAVECVFCLSAIEEGEEVRELKCRHLFHRSCLDEWLMRARATCPLCRDSLVPHRTWTTKMWDMNQESVDEFFYRSFHEL